MATAINAAAQDSTDSRKAKAARLFHDTNAASWVAYTNDFGSDNIALGKVTYKDPPNEFRLKLRKQGYVFDWGTLKWCQFYGTPPAGCFDAETIALHEFGHVQGLGHIEDAPDPPGNWTDSIMHETMRSKAQTGWNLHDFRRCDVARLQMRYEALTTSTLYSTCHDPHLSTVLVLSAPSTVPYSSNRTFTATLVIADSAPTNLQGDPVSSRSVILQRRGLSSSTWTDYANMTPLTDGTGRYQATILLKSTADWRARFLTPSNEGLIGSTSPIVRVTVEPCTVNCPMSVPEDDQ